MQLISQLDLVNHYVTMQLTGNEKLLFEKEVATLFPGASFLVV